MFNGRIEDVLDSPEIEKVKGKVNLILTSPPFPLVRKKRYGNETGEVYLSWLESLAGRLADLLTDDGSIVIEIGNAWEQGSPVMSTLPIEALLAFKKAAKLHLCQHAICHNPARLPSRVGKRSTNTTKGLLYSSTTTPALVNAHGGL
jgi:DNA methylase